MIYVVEDDAGIRDLVTYTLRASGYEAMGFQEGESLLAALETALPELILLDIMLPGDDGLTLLERIRNSGRTRDIPVILATAKGTEYDKVVGLDLGADDYLVKPFGMMEMLSRIRAVLRRTRPAPEDKSGQLVCGPLCMNLTEHTLKAEGVLVPLTPKEYDMLRLFMENPERVFTREQLLSQIWESDFFGESRTVDVHIGTLRTKLGAAAECIKTVRGVGYRLHHPETHHS